MLLAVIVVLAVVLIWNWLRWERRCAICQRQLLDEPETLKEEVREVINLNKLAQKVAREAGGKHNDNIADVKDVLAALGTVLRNEPNEVRQYEIFCAIRNRAGTSSTT